VDSLLQDIRYAIRTLIHAPGFTSVAVLALALGIGANTAIFTVVNAALIERLPFRDPDRLVIVWETSVRRPGRSNTVGPANYLRWRERATAFEDLAGFADVRQVLTGGGSPEEVTAQLSIGNVLQILGVPAMVGRTFTDAELTDPNSNVTVLTHAFWQRRFGGDAAILGRAIQLNGAPTTVVGVMPPDVRLLMRTNSLVGRPTDLWIPFPLPASARTPRGRSISVIGRLKPGVSLAQAQAQMDTIAAGLAAEFPAFDTGWGVRLLPLRDELAGDIRPALLVLGGAVAFVLLIGCANVANLLLARGAARQREIAIRSALGAARIRVMRQLLTESVVLGIAGGLLGLLVAQWMLALLVDMSPVDLRSLGHVRLSYPVLGFTAVISVLTAVVCGFAPAFETARAEVQDALKDGARQVGGSHRARRLRHAFVIAEIALSVVLLVGAGLMLRSFAALRAVDPGLKTRNVLTVRVALPGAKYDQPSKTLQFFDAAVRRIAALPGVQSAGIVSYLPFSTLGAATNFSIVGQPPAPPGQDYGTDVTVCDAGYLRTLGLPLVRGRLFTEREMREQSNVVVINEALARRYFQGEDPIGRQLVINMTSPNVPTAIIGIVGDAKFVDLRSEAKPASYWPHPQLPYTAMTFTVRTVAEPLSYASAVEGAVHAIDKDQPVSDVRTMDQWIARSLAQARFSSVLLTLFAILALLLASIGIYGVMSYSVNQRTSEIGIRLALGAEKRDIVRMVVGNGARLAAFGLAIGVALALALSRTLSGLLYETAGTDPLTFAAVVATLGAVALLASYVPARRASRIPPVEALRYQ
jgi:putative ABC transport system permease protein